VLRSGSLAPDGDSIGIPLFGSIATAGLAAPFVLGLTWLCLRRYSPATRVLAFRRDRPLRSILATLILGGAAVWLAIECVTGIVVVEPWYEYLWPIYIALVAFWLMALRAAVIEQD
jgi:hypothetical protein